MFNKEELKIILSGLDFKLKDTYRALSRTDDRIELESEVEDIKKLSSVIEDMYYG